MVPCAVCQTITYRTQTYTEDYLRMQVHMYVLYIRHILNVLNYFSRASRMTHHLTNKQTVLVLISIILKAKQGIWCPCLRNGKPILMWQLLLNSWSPAHLASWKNEQLELCTPRPFHLISAPSNSIMIPADTCPWSIQNDKKHGRGCDPSSRTSREQSVALLFLPHNTEGMTAELHLGVKDRYTTY